MNGMIVIILNHYAHGEFANASIFRHDLLCYQKEGLFLYTSFQRQNA